MQHLPVALSRAAQGLAVRSEPGTVAICFVATALRSVRDKRLDANCLLNQVGISPSLLTMAQARVSAKQYGQLWRLVARVIDDEFFGQDSRRMKPGSFAMLCHAVLNCPSLHHALERALRFFGLVLDDIAGKLEMRDSKGALVLTERAAEPRVFANEIMLMLVHGLACWLVGRRIPIIRASFRYAEPAHSAEYRLMYSTQLTFGAPHTEILFDAAHLALPIVQNEQTVKDFLRNAPENILVKYKNGSSIGARIRRKLRQALPGDLPEFERLAEDLNMTVATLRRRLNEEGTSYQVIKDQLRRDLAISYLSDSTRSAMDIGLHLGFSERSAFHRAFKKWTGASPGQFRRQLASEGT